VRDELARAGRLLVLPTLGFLAVLAFLPGRTTLATRIYALVVCVVVLAVALRLLFGAYRMVSPLRPRTGRREPFRRPPQSLVRLEQEAAIGVAGAFDLHHRLRPRLRALALDLLDTRRRLSLDRDEEQARRALGDATYELVRKDRSPPEDRLARGLPPAALAEVVESLERI
jgi:hypothetical protein